MSGCRLAVSLRTVINHLMYADDVVILNLYSFGLQLLLKLFSHQGKEHDIKFHAKQ